MESHDCTKEIEIPEWKEKGEGPNLYTLPCPICSKTWFFQPWTCTWSEMKVNQILTQKEIQEVVKEVLEL